MEIVVRSAIVFVLLWGITRVVGRATLGELSSFELILFITMGDLAQEGVTGQDSSVTGAVLAVGTMALLTIGISWVNVRSRRAAHVVSGRPVVVVERGEPDLPTMRSERLALDELLGAARQQGIERVDEIRLAVLEPNGKISFFREETASA